MKNINTFWHSKKNCFVEIKVQDIPREEVPLQLPKIGTEIELFFRKMDMTDAGEEAQAIFFDTSLGPFIHQEASAGLVEFATNPYTSVRNLVLEHSFILKKGVQWAEKNNLRVLPISFEPLATSAIPNWSRPYTCHQAKDKYGYGVSRLVSAASLQVNLEITAGDALLYVHEGWKRLMPVVVALTAASPFHQGLFTGLLAFRQVGRGIFLNGGPLAEYIPPQMKWKEYIARQIAMASIGEMFPIPCAHNLSLRMKLERGCLEIATPDVVGNLETYTAFCDFCRRVTFMMLLSYKQNEELPSFLGAPDDMAIRTALCEAVKFGIRGKCFTSDLKITNLRDTLKLILDWANGAENDETWQWKDTRSILMNVAEGETPAEKMKRVFLKKHKCKDPFRGCPKCYVAVCEVCEEVSRDFHNQVIGR